MSGSIQPLPACFRFVAENNSPLVRYALVALAIFLTLSGCRIYTDAATRLAYDIETAIGQLGTADGSTLTIKHATPSKPDECNGPFRVQFDHAGALIIWCKDANGQTVSSHSTSYHSRFVDTPKTYLVDKPAASLLTIQVERRLGRATITNVF